MNSPFVSISNVKASFLDDSISDHKLVWASLSTKNTNEINGNNLKTLNTITKGPKRSPELSSVNTKIDSAMLVNDEKVLNRYQRREINPLVLLKI